MRNLKKLLAILLATAMLFSFASVASAANISDAPDADKAESVLGQYGDSLEKTYTDAVQFMVDLGIVKGDEKGNLNLDMLYDRAQFAAMLYISINGGSSISASYSQQLPYFKDVAKTHWAYGYANWAGTTGLFTGTGDNNFSPDRKITLEEGLLVTMKALGLNTKNEGLDGLAWDGSAQNYIRNLAYNLQVLGDLLTLDSQGRLNRAEACLLNNYFISSEQIRYSVVTGERFRTGDNDGVAGIVGSNPSNKLLEKKFGFRSGKFEVLADGNWADLRGNTAGNGKAVLKRVDGDADSTPAKGTVVTLSADATKAIGFDLESVGHTYSVTYRAVSSGDVSQVYNVATKLTKETVLADINGNEDVEKDRLLKNVKDNTGITFKKVPYSQYRVNFNDPIEELAKYGSTRYSTTPAVADLDEDELPDYITFSQYNWDHCNIRVIYDNDNIKYVLIDYLSYGRISEIKDGKITLATTADGAPYDYAGGSIVNGKETKNIFGFDADTHKKDARVLVYRIGTDKFGIINPAKTAGRITFLSTSGGDPRLMLANATFKKSEDMPGNQLPKDKFLDGLVGQEGTGYTWNGRIFEWVEGQDETPGTYALVVGSESVRTSTTGLSGVTFDYYVDLLLEDNTRVVYPLASIVGKTLDKVAGDPVKAGGVSISDLVYNYSVSDGKVTLYPVTYKSTPISVALPNNDEVSVTTRFGAVWGTLNNKLVIDKTVTFIRTGKDGDYKYSAYVGQSIPKITTGAADNTASVVYTLTKLAATEDSVGVAYMKLGDHSTVPLTTTSWAIALGAVSTEYDADAKAYRRVIDILNSDGTKEVLRSDKTNSDIFTGFAKGTVFNLTRDADGYAVSAPRNGTVYTYLGGFNILKGISASSRVLIASDNSTIDYHKDAKFYNVDDGKIMTAAEAAAIDFSGTGDNAIGARMFTSGADADKVVIIGKFKDTANPPTTPPVAATTFTVTADKTSVLVGETVTYTVTADGVASGTLADLDGALEVQVNNNFNNFVPADADGKRATFVVSGKTTEVATANYTSLGTLTFTNGIATFTATYNGVGSVASKWQLRVSPDGSTNWEYPEVPLLTIAQASTVSKVNLAKGTGVGNTVVAGSEIPMTLTARNAGDTATETTFTGALAVNFPATALQVKNVGDDAWVTPDGTANFNAKFTAGVANILFKFTSTSAAGVTYTATYTPNATAAVPAPAPVAGTGVSFTTVTQADVTVYPEVALGATEILIVLETGKFESSIDENYFYVEDKNSEEVIVTGVAFNVDFTQATLTFAATVLANKGTWSVLIASEAFDPAESNVTVDDIVFEPFYVAISDFSVAANLSKIAAPPNGTRTNEASYQGQTNVAKISYDLSAGTDNFRSRLNVTLADLGITKAGIYQVTYNVYFADKNAVAQAQCQVQSGKGVAFSSTTPNYNSATLAYPTPADTSWTTIVLVLDVSAGFDSTAVITVQGNGGAWKEYGISSIVVDKP